MWSFNRKLSLGLAFGAMVISSIGFGAGYQETETRNNYVAWTMPGLTISSPSGFGAQWGQVFVGGGYQNRSRFLTGSDGAIGIGMGLGDAQKYVGLETSVSVYDVSAFKNGGVNFKLHRSLPAFFSVAVGREAALTWGPNSASKSWYGSVSKVFFIKDDPAQFFSALTLTAGVGDGRFRSQSNINANIATNGTGVNVFGSASLRIKEPVAVIADWTGQDLNLGLSITPIRTLGFFINPALTDITRTAGDGIRFVLGAGLAYSFI